MFFQGGLQEGISLALQQAKQVVCFVTDDGVESQQWEAEFLTDAAIKSGLESQSVVLRLPAGSQEAGYLEALFPVPKKPTVVVIYNGQMTEYIAAGTTKEEFIRRLSKALELAGSSQAQPSPAPASSATAVSRPSHQSQSTPGTPSTTAAAAATAVAAVPITSPAVAPQKGHPTTSEADKRASAEEKGKGRAETDDISPKNPEQELANENKIRKQHADEERRRILKRIEDDRRERKEREAEARRARQLLGTNVNANDDGAVDGNATASIPLARRMPKPVQGDHCSLQVRLLDGSTMRTRFPSDKTLAQDVRKWIDEERTDGDTPYSFRVVLTPLPNKVIEPQEEIKSLLSLGLTPSATLVLIPVRHSVAYARGGGVLTPVIGVFSTLYGAILASIGGIFTFLFGRSGGGASAPTTRRDDIPMETLRARRRDAQLYNGNSLNFEPRNDEDEDQQ